MVNETEANKPGSNCQLVTKIFKFLQNMRHLIIVCHMLSITIVNFVPAKKTNSNILFVTNMYE